MLTGPFPGIQPPLCLKNDISRLRRIYGQAGAAAAFGDSFTQRHTQVISSLRGLGLRLEVWGYVFWVWSFGFWV